MYNKIKSVLAIAIALTIWLSFSELSAASGDTQTGSTSTWTTSYGFSMTEVNVVDASTLKISFSKDLIEDTSMFEFLLTPKADETRELALTGLVLSASNELTATSVESLTPNTEYNLVVVFASDKEGNVIENWVDGMITFVTPEVFPEAGVVTEIPEEMTAAPVETMTWTESTGSTLTWVTTETAATEAQALPQTWTKEMMIIVLAMILALWFMFVRRKA